jgi:hypothetical protein
MDETGAYLVFSSEDWSLLEEVQHLTSPPTVHELHSDRSWTVGTTDGTVVIGQHHGDGFRYEHDLGDGPVQGALYYIREDNVFFAITALPDDVSSSSVEFWLVKDTGWVSFHEVLTASPVVSIHHVPGESDHMFIALEDGSVAQYRVTITDGPEDEKQPWYYEGRLWVSLAAVVVLVLVWRRMRAQDTE